MESGRRSDTQVTNPFQKRDYCCSRWNQQVQTASLVDGESPLYTRNLGNAKSAAPIATKKDQY